MIVFIKEKIFGLKIQNNINVNKFASHSEKSAECIRIDCERMKFVDLNLTLEEKLLTSEAEVQELKKLTQEHVEILENFRKEKERLNEEIKNLVIQVNNQPAVDHNKLVKIENDLTISQALVQKLNSEKTRLESDKTLLGKFDFENNTVVPRGRHGTGTVSRKIFSLPESRVPQIWVPDLRISSPSHRIRIVQISVPVHHPANFERFPGSGPRDPGDPVKDADPWSSLSVLHFINLPQNFRNSCC